MYFPQEKGVSIQNDDATRSNSYINWLCKAGGCIYQTATLTGCAKQEDVFIPKIPTIYRDVTSQFRRLQFPLGLAFAIFINKAQGQALTQIQVLKLGVLFFSRALTRSVLLRRTNYVHVQRRLQSGARWCTCNPSGFSHNLLFYV
jgi:ATP-dependent DNA helicase PIF1